MCVCVSVCVKNQTFWCREALTPNFRCEQGKTVVPDDASNLNMLIDHCESQGDIIFGTNIDRRVAIETASYAALVADYLAVSWADKALAFLEPLLADTNTNPKPNRKKPRSNPLSPIQSGAMVLPSTQRPPLWRLPRTAARLVTTACRLHECSLEPHPSSHQQDESFASLASKNLCPTSPPG